jgi:hypothetical protein
METAKARMIEKNTFMVLKYSLPAARVRLPESRAIFAAKFLPTVEQTVEKSLIAALGGRARLSRGHLYQLFRSQPQKSS